MIDEPTTASCNPQNQGADAPRSPHVSCDRFWLLTSTTYGSWLPGDRRGFVGPIDAEDGYEVHNRAGTEYDADIPRLERFAEGLVDGRRILLTTQQAAAVADQFQETAGYRGWELFAAAVMANHFHIVVGVPGDPSPSDLLRDFKSYAGRRLNRRCGRPASGTWWTEHGSKRKLPDSPAVSAAVRYVRNQPRALCVRITESL